MLDRQDLQHIGSLLDEKLEENNKKLVTKDELKLEENNEKLVSKDSLKSILEENNEKLVARIAIEVGNVIEQNVTPILDEHTNMLSEYTDRLTRIEAQMVTKSFLTDQLGNLKEEVIGRVRKEDAKVGALIDSLDEQSVLDKRAIKKLRAIEVFPASPNPLSP